MNELSIIVEKLLVYAKEHLDLDELDLIYTRNLLLNKLNIDEPYYGEFEKDYIKDLSVPDVLLDELRVILSEQGVQDIELLLVDIMGMLSPLPSVVRERVLTLEQEKSGLGLDYLFNLQIKNNYIQKTAIDRNVYFKKEFEDNFLEITINLSKPEKKNSDIKKLLTDKVQLTYPKCLLCIENLGYKGRSNHPARENIRIVPLKLDGEDWFLQYSPYAYFDHHAIIINNAHTNMSISHQTFKKLLEFVNVFPTFFVGSNSDLPIVGGSILNHEHYQGGLHLLPVFYSKDRKVFLKNDDVKISVLNWYNTVIRIESKSIETICKYADRVFDEWIVYNDESVDIVSHTGNTRHSTITPIARKINDVYQLNMILRNNRTSDEHPDGIFHAHKEYHHIKQEGIGLIEAMGLFILPPRLKRQMGYVEEILSSNDDVENYYSMYQDLLIHKNMIDELIAAYGRNISKEKAHNIIEDYLANVCKNILINTACLKDDEAGRASLDKFMNKVLFN